jgi:acyl carrier protein
MVPSSFVALDEIPLTPNGKVDRLALLALKPSAAVTEEEYVAPRNELEERIAAAWAETLGIEQVPIHTNFFDLGGHSLLLAQVRVKLQETLGRSVSIIELFQYPTVSGLAGHLDAASGPGREPRRRERDLSAGRKKLASRRRARR